MVTSARGTAAIWVDDAPPLAAYTITGNDLRNAANTSLIVSGPKSNLQGGQGIILTADGNTFDGSKVGAQLDNIKGPFTLSHTNTFVNSGTGGGIAFRFSGKDVTVDGWSFSAPNGGVGVWAFPFPCPGHACALPSAGTKIINNTITGFNDPIRASKQQSIELSGNVVTSAPGTAAIVVDDAPPLAAYTITGNDLRNAANTSLIVSGPKSNLQGGQGIILTADGNTFDGSKVGAQLDNIKGPFTLSHTNTFVNSGTGGGIAFRFSGKDVTVDGWSFSAPNGRVGVWAFPFPCAGHACALPSAGIKISNNTITGFNDPIRASKQQSIELSGNVVTSARGTAAIVVDQAPPLAAYTITNNDLRNAANTSLVVSGPGSNLQGGGGIILTADGNNFDGSKTGLSLDNIKGPFTLSHTNTFVNAGTGGGIALRIAGKDVTVDGWSFSAPNGGVGIWAFPYSCLGHACSRPSERIKISNNTITGFNDGIRASSQQSLELSGNVITSAPGTAAIVVDQAPPLAAYTISGNDLRNAANTSLIVSGPGSNLQGGQGIILTADGNRFDGSKNGASLDNIKGPFTLSTTNTFVNSGTGGGIALGISGKDVTIDGHIFGASNGGIGVNINVFGCPGHACSRPSERMTVSNTLFTGFGTGLNANGQTDLTVENVTTCGNGRGIALQQISTGTVTSGRVGGNSIDGIHVFAGSTNILIDGVNFDGNPAGKDVVDDTGAATVQNSTNDPFDCPPAVALTSVAVTPDPASVAVGSTIQFTATGTFADDSTANITDGMWTSSNLSVATIDAATGVATGVALGTTNITAMKETITSPTVTLSVVYTCMGLAATIVGTAGPDHIVGTAGDDVIASLGGNDTVLGLAGNDIICLGDGNDFGDGGPGRDKVWGEDGDDDIRGGGGGDRLYGGRGEDVLRGGRGNDRLYGGRHDDVLKGGTGKDRLSGNGGNDVLVGGKHDDRLFGARGGDVLLGRAGDDSHDCGSGIDFANGGSGTDTATGDCESTLAIP